MKIFFKKHKIYFEIALYAIFIACIIFFVIRPLVFKISDKNNSIQEKIAERENKKEKLEKIPAIREQIEKINTEEGKIDIILTRENIVDLIKKIEKISEETGNKVNIEVIDDTAKKPEKAKKDDKDASLSDKLENNQELVKMNIKLTGKYQNFLDFVRKIENNEYYSDIVSIKITKEKENRSSNPFSGSMEEKEQLDHEYIFSTLEIIFYLKKQ